MSAMDALKVALRRDDFYPVDFTPREPRKARVCMRDNQGCATVYVHLNVPDTYTPGDIKGLKEKLDKAAEPYLFGKRPSIKVTE